MVHENAPQRQANESIPTSGKVVPFRQQGGHGLKLLSAERLASKYGFRIFPILTNTKNAAIKDWPRQATSNLAKYQVLSQTGIAALSQANSVQQEILKLLQ